MPEGLPCTECPRRESDLEHCDGDSECIEAVELVCSNSALKCCSTYAQELVNLGIINPGEADDDVCPAADKDGNTLWSVGFGGSLVELEQDLKTDAFGTIEYRRRTWMPGFT